MKTFLPTLEFCLDVVEAKSNLKFFYKTHTIDNTEVYTFDYFIASESDFYHLGKPLHELRGLTFVKYSDDKIERFLNQHKFYNINQVEYTQLSYVKNFQILEVSEKHDGSIINFVRINDKIYAKSKMSFDSEQAVAANKILNSNKYIYNFVKNCLDNNLSPIFEYCYYTNRVVLNYDEETLYLLQVRNNLTGEYLDISTLDTTNIKIAEREPVKDFEHYVTLAKTLTNREGWIIKYLNDKNEVNFLKIKTEWYFNQHHIRTEQIHREDFIISLYLENKIDDLLSQLNPIDNANEIQRVNEIIAIIDSRMLYIENEVLKLQEKFTNFKDFSNEYHKHYAFDFAVNNVRNSNLREKIVERILKATYNLQYARNFLTIPESEVFDALTYAYRL